MNRATIVRIAGVIGICVAANGDGPVVPGVKSCLISDGHGGYVDFSGLCDWSQICCVAPLYGACPFPPGGTCLLSVTMTCCHPLDGCYYQRVGIHFNVWCGEPFPP